MTYRFRILLLLLSLFLSFAAQTQTVQMEILTPKEGLSQGYVGCMVQDKEGYLWLGTKNGLNRYDGRQFIAYTHDPFNPFSISKDWVESLLEVGDFLLVGTLDGGLNIFHKKTQRFYHLEAEGLSLNKGSTAHIRSIGLDAEGNIWTIIAYQNAPTEIYSISLPPHFWQNLPQQPDLCKTLKAQLLEGNNYNCFTMLKTGKELWVSRYDSIFTINTQTHLITPFSLPFQNQPAFILNIVENTDGTSRDNREGGLWVIQERHINRFENGRWTNYPLDFTLNGGLFALETGHFWVHEKQGLLAFPLPQESGIIPREKALFKYAIPVNFASHLVDRSGILWLGSAGLGVLKFNHKRNRIRHYFQGKPIYSPVYGGSNQSIGYYNLTTQQFEFTTLGNPLTPLLAVSKAEYGYWQGRLWDKIGGGWWFYFENLECTGWLKIGANQSIEKKYCIKKSLSIRGNCQIDAQGILWSAQDGQLVRFNPTTEQSRIFDFSYTEANAADIYCLAQTSNGVWWIGTAKGLVQATPTGDTFRFELFKQKLGERNALRNNIVAALQADPTDKNGLWIGTKGGGLTHLDISTGQFRHWTTHEGLSNDVIYGILTDDENNLWLSSNKGIVRFNPRTGAIKNFTEEDGLLNDELNTWAYGKSPTGELLFGGVNGLNVFHPKDLTDNNTQTQTHITGLLVNNKTVSPNDSTGLIREGVEFLTKLRLPFGQNNITLQFAALEFSAPRKNRFRYYLEGAEKEWAHESTENFATYLNLAAGTYTFKVKSANSDGVWNETPVLLNITVLPPWYRSWWAYLAYLAAIVWAVRAYLRFREKQLQLTYDLEKSHQEAVRLNELDAFKTRFFTNISHEFRTPLTVIMGMTDKLKTELPPLSINPKNDTFKSLDLIKRNGENLLRLINQILDLTRLENNVLKINYLQGDIISYISYIVESLQSFANTRNVLIKIETEQSAIIMDYDAERLLQILYNLIANAIKFTPSGGRIEVKIAKKEGGQFLKIQVIDTGVGIPAEDLPSIFDRFFKANNQSNEGGIGIGLSLTKELVKAMKGTISVESEKRKGTIFTILLPIKNEATQIDFDTSTFQKFETFGKLDTEILPPSVSEPFSTEKPRLLIIEDNADVIEYIASCLSNSYQLDFAYNGRAGLEKVFENSPDIIISDVMMPEMDGFNVCDTVKNDERSSHIPLVLLTARATVEDRIEGLKRGADAYLAKPFNPEELTVTLQKLLDNQKRLQAYFTQFALNFTQNTEGGKISDALVETTIEDAFLTKLKTLLHAQMGKSDLTAEEIGKEIGMSRANLYAKLTALTGLSFNLYLRELRLQRAKILLTTTQMNVSEVAYEVGFNDPRYFSRLFSEAFGVPPSEFQAKRQ